MPFVTLVSDEQAAPELKQIYNQVRQSYGSLPDYFQALGRAPAVIPPHLALGQAILSDGALSRKEKEEILVVVSGINTSSYCVARHMQALRNLGVDPALSRKLAVDHEHAPVEEKLKALFRFADKLTRKPEAIEQADADAVRAAGWDEAALSEAVAVVAWANFINRVSIGLGLVVDF